MTRFTLTIVSLFALATQSVNANDFSNVRSGLLLGVYAAPSQGGMRVSNTIPGYSADGRLFPGDVLMRVAVENGPVYNLRSNYEMENAKMAIGSGREAGVEIYRPGQGYIYAWVEFTPIYGPTAAYSVRSGQPSQPRAKASFRMENEKPGARQLFQRPGAGGGNTHQIPGRAPNRSAANLFNR